MGLQTAPAYIANNNDASPGPQTQFQHPVELDRNLHESLFLRSGYLRYGDLAVTTPGSGLTVNVAAGAAFVNGVESNTQGGYFAWSNASEALSIAAPSASTRYDSIILRVADPQYGTVTGNSRAYWDVVQGAAGAGVPRADSYFNSGGGAYVPGGWFRVADIQVDPGVTSIAANKITQNQQYVSMPGGEIFCLSTSRPTATLGLRIYEIDTGLRYGYDSVSATWKLSSPYKKIQVLSGTAASISFQSIPTTLNKVKISWKARSDTAAVSTTINLRFNNDSSNNYYGTTQQVVNTTHTPASPSAQNACNVGQIMAANAAAGAGFLGIGWAEVIGWTGFSKLNFVFQSHAYDTAPNSWYTHGGYLYNVAGPYTRIDLIPGAGNFITGSTFTLEGWD